MTEFNVTSKLIHDISTRVINILYAVIKMECDNYPSIHLYTKTLNCVG